MDSAEPLSALLKLVQTEVSCFKQNLQGGFSLSGVEVTLHVKGGPLKEAISSPQNLDLDEHFRSEGIIPMCTLPVTLFRLGLSFWLLSRLIMEFQQIPRLMGCEQPRDACRAKAKMEKKPKLNEV